jgi:probable phosphoglycerate mutase
MPDVVLIRPGCTDFDEQNRIQGVLDLPLNHRGHAQVLGLVAQLQEVSFDVVFTAPCEPARSTAQAICEQSGASLKEVDDFRNLDHGLWQGLQVDDVRRKYPKVFKQWQESPETVCLPEGETVSEAVERIRHGLRKCLKRKKIIGIVASEPLATMIGCVLRGERPAFPETCDGTCRRPTIERISLASPEVPEQAAAARNGNGAGNGSAHAERTARNGKATSNGTPQPGANSRSAPPQKPRKDAGNAAPPSKRGAHE